MARTVRVQYHHEPEGWWAESDDVPGFVAAGATVREVRELVREGIPFYLEASLDELDLVESSDRDGLVVDVRFAPGSFCSPGSSWQPSLQLKVSAAARTPVWA